LEDIGGSGDEVVAEDKSSFPLDDILLANAGNTREGASVVRSIADSREFIAAAVGLPFTGAGGAVTTIEIPLVWDVEVCNGLDEDGPERGCGVCLGPAGALGGGFVAG
jgi:hypothetical protein